jgi:hypothetical protein
MLFGGIGKVYNIPDRNALKRRGRAKWKRQILLLVDDNRKQELGWQKFHTLEVRKRTALVITTLGLEVCCVKLTHPGSSRIRTSGVLLNASCAKTQHSCCIDLRVACGSWR